MSRWELDRWVRRSDGGRLLAGGAPARLLRLSEAGAAALDRALAEPSGCRARQAGARAAADAGADEARATTVSDGGANEARATTVGDGGADETGTAAADDRTGAAEKPAAAEASLLKRLRDAGLLHPVPDRASTAPLTTVIPVHNGGDSLPALVAAARRWGEVIVVDDRSTDGSAARATAAGARVIASPGPPGPAAARNAGLRAAGTELVAFIDADCETDADFRAGAAELSAAMRHKAQPHSPGDGWAPRLAALLEDDAELALVAPRVRSAPGAGAVAHYEATCSPLDLGGAPGLVGPGRRLGYVPSTAFVARRPALLALGGFDETLRFGEDVDLVWRLVAAGQRVRYAAQVEVLHRPRPTPVALARQRFEYGRSAATLDRLHPGEAAPLRLDRYSAATLAAATLLGWRAAVSTAAAGVAFVASRGAEADRRPPAAASPSTSRSDSRQPSADIRRALAIVAARGQLQTARQLSHALVRDWLPLTALACAVSPRARRVAALAALADLIPTVAAQVGPTTSAAPTSPQPGTALFAAAATPSLPTALALRPLDHAAYAAGLWAGAARAGSPRALIPRLIFTGR